MEFSKLVSTQDVRQHNSPEDCWIVIDDHVWDVTKFAPEHPGGANCMSNPLFDHCISLMYAVLLKYAGRDATKAYSEYHSPSVAKDNLSLDCFKGNLDRSTIDEAWQPEPVASNSTQTASDDEKPPLHNIINRYTILDTVPELSAH
jgi:L-lactate dehydrogenase (cytochrome)